MRPKLKHARTAAKWLVRLVLIGLLCVIAAAVTVLVILPRASHGTALTVLTGSMTPDIPVGSVVIDRPVDPGTLHVGDIATYQTAPGVNEYITHRIIKIDTSKNPVLFTFKGDANRGPDITPVPAGAIRGKVWFHVPYLGAIRDSLKGAFGRTLILAVVVLGLGGFAAKQFTDEIRARRRRRSGSDAADDQADEPATLAMSFDLDAFGDVDPSFVAELLQGECEVLDDTFVLRFSADDERLTVLRALLAPYGVELPQAEESDEPDAPAGVCLTKTGSQDREPAHV